MPNNSVRSSTLTMSPKDLTTISKQEFTEFINSFDEVLCDCDGVIFILYKVFDGVKDCVEVLKTLGKKVKYVTNNSSVTRNIFAEKLTKQGIVTDEDDILNPARAVVDYLTRIKFDKKVYAISLPNLRRELENVGIRVANEYKPELSDMNPESFLKSLMDLDPEVGAVLVCFDFNMTYLNLDRAINYLEKPDVLFLTTGYDQKIIVAPNKFCLGPSYFQDMLVKVSGRKPTCLGKPMEGFSNFIKNSIKCEPRRTLFVGDSLEQDIGFAKKLGFQSLLVLTGNTTLEDLKGCDEEVMPNYYINSMADFGKFIKQNIN